MEENEFIDVTESINNEIKSNVFSQNKKILSFFFKIINSSAGSGKTFKLAIEYISKLLSKQNDEHFKSTLALTFTNKASAEMKYRILLFLNDLKHQRDELVLEQILKTTSLDESAIQKRSSTILEKILYNYSNFNVITIDSFTNNIIRTIYAESDKKDDFLVEFDNQIYIDQAIDDLISEINANNELKELLVEFAKYKLTINKSWDISYDLIKFGLFIDKESNRHKVEYFKKKNLKFFQPQLIIKQQLKFMFYKVSVKWQLIIKRLEDSIWMASLQHHEGFLKLK